MSRHIDDIRYSELLFLQSFNGDTLYWNAHDDRAREPLRLSQALYIDLAITLLEDWHVELENDRGSMLVARLRHEASTRTGPVARTGTPQWDNVRAELRHFLTTGNSSRLRITYRGLRRIDELRDVLRNERILEHFGILLDMRYFQRDLEFALKRPPDTPVSLLCLDMDRFKRINDDYGHPAGDTVMKAYLQVVKDAVGLRADAYRGSGDEVKIVVVGLGHDGAVGVAEDIRRRVEALQPAHAQQPLPQVTASIGVSSSPPDARSRDLEGVADDRQRRAKSEGRNRVVSE